jgi:hypothetical protein
MSASTDDEILAAIAELSLRELEQKNASQIAAKAILAKSGSSLTSSAGPLAAAHLHQTIDAFKWPNPSSSSSTNTTSEGVGIGSIREVQIVDQWGPLFTESIKEFEAPSAICGYAVCATAHVLHFSPYKKLEVILS